MRLRCLLSFLVLTAPALAQSVAERLAAATLAIEVEDWQAALELLLPLATATDATADEGDEIARRLDQVVVHLATTGDFRPAQRACEAALALRRRLVGEGDHPDIALALNNLGLCVSSLGNKADALRHYEAALAMQRRLWPGRDHPDLVTTLLNAADCARALGRVAEALPRYEEALVMVQRLTAHGDHPDVAVCLNSVAICLAGLGRAAEALPRYEAALAMNERLYAGRDHPDLASSTNNLASCLQALGRDGEALPRHEAALAMTRRLAGDRADRQVAIGLNNVAVCLQALGRAAEALPRFREALAVHQRLVGDRDDADVAMGLNNEAWCLEALGRAAAALISYEAALAMRKRLFGAADHPDVAMSLNNLAFCLHLLGRESEALPLHEAALAMRRRLFGEADHPDVAMSLNNLALSLGAVGRGVEALPQFETALAIQRRLHGDRDHPLVAMSLNNSADCLRRLGRPGDAAPRHEAALAMWRRLFGDVDHPDIALGLNGAATCLLSLGRAGDALPGFEKALAMQRRLFRHSDHPLVATSLNNIASCLRQLGQPVDGLRRHEEALAMWRRLFGDRDHPFVATGLHNVAASLTAADRPADALPLGEAALAMRQRLFGDRDHPDLASSLDQIAQCLQDLGRPREAVPPCRMACLMIERMREHSATSPDVRQSYFDALKRGGAFERLQALLFRDDATGSWAAAERARGRDLLDLLEQQRGDPLVEAELRAARRGDEQAVRRLQQLRTAIAEATLTDDRLLHELIGLATADLDEAERTARREAIVARSDRAALRLRQLHDEQGRLLSDVLPVGRVRGAPEVQAALRDGELLLEYTVTSGLALLYVVGATGAVQAIELPDAFASVQRVLPSLLQRSSHAQLRGRDPGRETGAPANAADRDLFASLVPAPLWDRLRTSRRVFLAAHRELHRVPFELLVTGLKDGRPTYWLDDGPPISYVPSATVLHWLRQRAKETSDDATSCDLLAVGDPRALEAAPEVPKDGVFVLRVDERGEGARVGLQPGDVLVSYDGKALVDDTTLRDGRRAVEDATESNQRPDAPIQVEVWRRGEVLRLSVRNGQLGLEVGRGRAKDAYEASLGGDAQRARISRAGDLERIGHLPPLAGARAETEAIAKVFVDRKADAKLLLGIEATEPGVFDLAGKAKYLHFACHGIAEEYSGQSLSMLVLSQPPHVLPGNDGLLKLPDLWQSWRGRLSSCRLVVLSACRTNIGPTLRDEAPQALPIGFLFAGVPSVISSLWAVDDTSTRELMTDFYGRLLAGETDKLAAFTAAKKALRAKYPDPFHWAPFLYMGAPE